MCGRMNVTDNEGIQNFLDSLGIEYPISPALNIAPGAQAEFVAELGVERELTTGYWSLLIEPKKDKVGFRPSPKYKTFNAQSRRLNESRLWSRAYQKTRCIVPVSGFHEWKDGHCYNITPVEDDYFAMAGLYSINTFDGLIVPSFTIITLPPQDKFNHIHDKSFPFMLKTDECDEWLDPAQNDVTNFENWMNEGIRFPIRVATISSPNDLTEHQHQLIV